MWDEESVRWLGSLLADRRYSYLDVSAGYYYALASVRRPTPIYGDTPRVIWSGLTPGSRGVFDADNFKFDGDWICGGELVFDAPISYCEFLAALRSGDI
jgi:hypothetical protein